MLKSEINRAIKQGVVNFWRNGWVSLATVLVMVLALFVLGALFFSNVLLTSALSRLEEKVDISVYFKTSAPEEDILALKSALGKLQEVKAVEYVSSDQALAAFQERHAENALITQALEELGENPLGASLNVKAKDPRQYEAISRFLEAESFENIVDKINYRQNQVVIEKLTGILKASRALGLGITLALSAIAFLVEGVIHGAIASVLTMLAFWPLAAWLGPKADRFFGGPNLLNYYLSNFLAIFLMLLTAGVVLGVISSLIATRRYLKER